MTSQTIPPIYKLHIWIRQISPMIWRRILVRSESSIAQLHDIIQIAFGWSDSHLHRFRIHGRDYGVSRPGGPGLHLQEFSQRLRVRQSSIGIAIAKLMEGNKSQPEPLSKPELKAQSGARGTPAVFRKCKDLSLASQSLTPG